MKKIAFINFIFFLIFHSLLLSFETKLNLNFPYKIIETKENPFVKNIITTSIQANLGKTTTFLEVIEDNNSYFNPRIFNDIPDKRLFVLLKQWTNSLEKDVENDMSWKIPVNFDFHNKVFYFATTFLYKKSTYFYAKIIYLTNTGTISLLFFQKYSETLFNSFKTIIKKASLIDNKQLKVNDSLSSSTLKFLKTQILPPEVKQEIKLEEDDFPKKFIALFILFFSISFFLFVTPPKSKNE